MKIEAKVGAYSSVVGAGVLIVGDGGKGRMEGQVAILCHTDTLRDKAVHLALCEVIAKALDGMEIPEADHD